MTPDLAHLAVVDVEDLDAVVLQLLVRPLAADRDERDGVLIVGNDIVHLGTNRASRQFELAAKLLKHLSHALVVPGQRAPAGDVVADVFGEELTLQRVGVASSEGGIALPHQVLVWMCHLIPPQLNAALSSCLSAGRQGRARTRSGRSFPDVTVLPVM